MRFDTVVFQFDTVLIQQVECLLLNLVFFYSNFILYSPHKASSILNVTKGANNLFGLSATAAVHVQLLSATPVFYQPLIEFHVVYQNINIF